MDRKSHFLWAIGSVVGGIAFGAVIFWGAGAAYEIGEHYKRLEEERQTAFIRKVVRQVIEQDKYDCYLGFCEKKKQ